MYISWYVKQENTHTFICLSERISQLSELLLRHIKKSLGLMPTFSFLCILTGLEETLVKLEFGNLCHDSPTQIWISRSKTLYASCCQFQVFFPLKSYFRKSSMPALKDYKCRWSTIWIKKEQLRSWCWRERMLESTVYSTSNEPVRLQDRNDTSRILEAATTKLYYK